MVFVVLRVLATFWAPAVLELLLIPPRFQRSSRSLSFDEPSYDLNNFYGSVRDDCNISDDQLEPSDDGVQGSDAVLRVDR